MYGRAWVSTAGFDDQTVDGLDSEDDHDGDDHNDNDNDDDDEDDSNEDDDEDDDHTVCNVRAHTHRLSLSHG